MFSAFKKETAPNAYYDASPKTWRQNTVPTNGNHESRKRLGILKFFSNTSRSPHCFHILINPQLVLHHSELVSISYRLLDGCGVLKQTATIYLQTFLVTICLVGQRFSPMLKVVLYLQVPVGSKLSVRVHKVLLRQQFYQIRIDSLPEIR